MCNHNNSFTLPCTHNICKTCFFEDIKTSNYAKCTECSFDTKQLDFLADSNNTHACYILGKMYHDGKSVKCDKQKAIELYNKALLDEENCDSNVYGNLVKIYLKTNKEKAIEICKKAVEKKKFFPDVYELLGDMYCEQDNKEALKWYTSATTICLETIHIDRVYFNIALIHTCGTHGVEKNYTEAVMWYEKIKEDKKCIEISYNNLSIIYKNGGYGIIKDCVKSDEYSLKCAKMKDYPCLEYEKIGNTYFSENDNKNGIKWYKMAFDEIESKKIPLDTNIKERKLTIYELRDSICDKLARIYCDGRDDVTKDYMESYKWFERNNDTILMGHVQYITGNYVRAVEILKNENEPYAYRLLGHMHFRGNSEFNTNYKKAFHWYNLGANKNDPECKLYLGNLYYEGKGVDKDYMEACTCYKSLVTCTDKDVQKKALFKLYTLYKKINNTKQYEKYKSMYIECEGCLKPDDD